MLHFQRTDEFHKPSFGLNADWTHFPRTDDSRRMHCVEFVETQQHRGCAEHRFMQGDDHLIAVAPPVAFDALPGHVEIAGGHRNGDARYSWAGSSDDEIVQEHAPVHETFPKRVEVKDVGRDALVSRFRSSAPPTSWDPASATLAEARWSAPENSSPVLPRADPCVRWPAGNPGAATSPICPRTDLASGNLSGSSAQFPRRHRLIFP